MALLGRRPVEVAALGLVLSNPVVKIGRPEAPYLYGGSFAPTRLDDMAPLSGPR